MKKNDKIIIVIAAVIIVIAAVGVATWSGDDTEPFHPKDTKTTYRVTWQKNTGTELRSGTTSDGETTSELISIDKDNLLYVSFNISWTDDKPGLFNMKTDTVTFKVSPPDVQPMEESKTVKKGSIPFNFSGLNSLPSEFEIKADDGEEAFEEVERNYTEDNGKGDWNCDITIDVGRVITKGFDKGNSWEMSIKYAYYKPLIQPLTEEENNDDVTTGGEDDGSMVPSSLSTEGMWNSNIINAIKNGDIKIL